MTSLSTRPKPVLEITSPARRRHRRAGRGLALGLIAFLAGTMVLAYERGHSDKQAQAEQQSRALAARPSLYPSDYIAADWTTDWTEARMVTLVAGEAR